MISPLHGFPEHILAFAASGKVSANDYEQVLIPAIKSAAESQNPLRLLYCFTEQFEGFELGALWDDAAVGLQYISRWERIAVVCDQEWLRVSVSGLGFLLPAEVRLFPVSGMADAREWICN